MKLNEKPDREKRPKPAPEPVVNPVQESSESEPEEMQWQEPSPGEEVKGQVVDVEIDEEKTLKRLAR